MKPLLVVVPMIVLGVLATLRGVARAQPTGAQAEVLFRQGKDLMAKGKYAEACAAFDASQKLEGSTSTVLNEAACREKNGQLATAWGLFLDAERQTRGATDPAGKQMHDIAVDRAGKLEPRLSTLAIDIPDDVKIGGLEILRDSDVVDPGAWNKTLPVDGGTYRITARAPGNAEWTTTVSVNPERDAKVVDIPKLKAADLGKPVPAPAPAPLPDAQPAPVKLGPTTTDAVVTESAPSRATWVPYAVGGGAVALLGGALAFEHGAESTFDQAKAERDRSKQLSLWNSANTERYTAEAFAIGGVAAASVAVWLYLRDRNTGHGVAVAPITGGDRAGIQLVGGF